MSLLTRRMMIVAGLVLAAVAAAFALEFFLSPRPDQPLGHTQTGHAVGWAGLLLILLVFAYPIRKRFAKDRRWPKGWFQVHKAFGILGPILILIHSGAHFHALVPVLAMIAMGLVVVSGITGQVLHYLALRTLNERQRELAHQGLSDAEIQSRLHDLAGQEETFRIWQCIHAPLTATFVILMIMHVVGALYFGGL
jgi:cytochrome b561